MAQWLGEAVTQRANQQAGNLVIPPGKPAPAEPIPLPDIDLAGLAAAINAAVGATVAAGATPSRSLGRDATATLRRYMRASRGLPERQTRRQTIVQNRQTLKLIVTESAPSQAGVRRRMRSAPKRRVSSFQTRRVISRHRCGASTAARSRWRPSRPAARPVAPRLEGGGSRAPFPE